MKAFCRCGVAACVLLIFIVFFDVYNYTHAIIPSFNSYPMLPYNAYPLYVRGTNRTCYTMEEVIGMFEYSNACGYIESWVERSDEVDSLCIYSVLQYGWKKDSILMEVILEDDSRRWLLVSPPSCKDYTCKLEEVDITKNIELSSFHLIRLVTQYWNWERNQSILMSPNESEVYIKLILIIIYGLSIISIIILNIVCLVLGIMHYKEIFAAKNTFRKIMYICIPVIPTLAYIILRMITYSTF